MKKLQMTKLCAWSLGIFFLSITPAYSQSASPPSHFQWQQLTSPEVSQELVTADVVYLGETHSSFKDHQVQLEILKALYRQNGKIAIAMEMFQRHFQDVLEQYLAGKITEAQLREQSEYKQRWGFPWTYYAPILRFAKAHQLPVVALNAPTEVTRKVARQGLESLTSAERRYIPPLSEIRTDNAAYRQMVWEVYQGHAHGNSGNFEQFFTAQVLWDETMADRIAQFYAANPQYQVVVLAGQGHIVCGYGIPNRVERRIDHPSFVQRSVLLGATSQ